MEEFGVTGTPAGAVVVRAGDLRVRGMIGTVGGQVPRAGELAVFCRPVVTAPAVVRRDGTVLAGGWLPDFARLGELERHLGDGVIEEIVSEAVAGGRMRAPPRRRGMAPPPAGPPALARTPMPGTPYTGARWRPARRRGRGRW